MSLQRYVDRLDHLCIGDSALAYAKLYAVRLTVSPTVFPEAWAIIHSYLNDPPYILDDCLFPGRWPWWLPQWQN